MIKIKVLKKDEIIKSVITKGHANFAEHGKDIVCAGVSAVVTGGINALESEIENIKIINEENTLGVEVINSNDKIQLILKTILIQLETIESSYKKYIKIRK